MQRNSSVSDRAISLARNQKQAVRRQAESEDKHMLGACDDVKHNLWIFSSNFILYQFQYIFYINKLLTICCLLQKTIRCRLWTETIDKIINDKCSHDSIELYNWRIVQVLAIVWNPMPIGRKLLRYEMKNRNATLQERLMIVIDARLSELFQEHLRVWSFAEIAVDLRFNLVEALVHVASVAEWTGKARRSGTK